MKRTIACAAALALSGSMVTAQSGTQPATKGDASMAASRTVVTRAAATLKGEGISGTAEFTEVKEGTATYVEIVVKATGLKPGLHGVHLHAVGKCEPDFTAAGGHFDPGPTGNTDPDANHPFHMGDLPNLEAGADGAGTLSAMSSRVTLSAGPLSLMDDDGTAIIIHGNEDKGTTGAPKSGVSGGPRVACGVIEKKM